MGVGSFGATGKMMGFSGGPEVHSGQNLDQAVDMVCDPAISIAINSNCTARVEGKGKERADVAGTCENNEALLSPTLNHLDGRSSSSFTDFLLFLQKLQTEGDSHADYNSSVIYIVRFFEEKFAENWKASSLGKAQQDAFHRSEMAPLTGQHQLNHPDGRSRSNFTDFLLFLKKLQAGGDSHADCNSSLIYFVRFLEGKNAENVKASSLEKAQRDAFHQSEMARLIGQHQHQVTEIESRSEGKIRELSCSKEIVSKQLAEAQAQLSSVKIILTTTQSELHSCNEAYRRSEGKLDKANAQNKSLSETLETTRKSLNATKKDLENVQRLRRDAEQTDAREVQRLMSIIQEKDKAVGEMQSASTQMTSVCEKLKAQISAIEQESSQESLTSGSYADDHANPALLQTACRSVDMAKDILVKFLFENSLVRKIPPGRPETESFISSLSRASSRHFSRQAHVKHVWGHWICAKMFQGFEHVFFDISEERTSPVDSKRWATECFQSFQEKKSISSTECYETCDLFREYCGKKYPLLFPSRLVNEARVTLASATCDGNGRFQGDEKLYRLFMDVAKAIWLLHELAFSFDPPASILRMGYGEPFDKLVHESVIKDADCDVTSSKVVLTTRPGFRVKKNFVKSLVFLSNEP